MTKQERKLLEMLISSDSYIGITFKWCYNIEELHLFEMFKLYKRTGENLLDSYTDIMNFSWQIDDLYQFKSEISKERFNEILNRISNPFLKKFFDRDVLLAFEKYATNAYNKHLKIKS